MTSAEVGTPREQGPSTTLSISSRVSYSGMTCSARRAWDGRALVMGAEASALCSPQPRRELGERARWAAQPPSGCAGTRYNSHTHTHTHKREVAHTHTQTVRLQSDLQNRHTIFESGTHTQNRHKLFFDRKPEGATAPVVSPTPSSQNNA